MKLKSMRSKKDAGCCEACSASEGLALRRPNLRPDRAAVFSLSATSPCV